MSARISGLLLGVALALTITAASAVEDADSANAMLPGCKEAIAHRSPVSARQAFCLGTVRGIAFMGSVAKLHHVELKLLLNEPSISMDILREDLCMDVPDVVTTGQYIGVIISYIEARPARLREDFRGLALQALRAAWPRK